MVIKLISTWGLSNGEKSNDLLFHDHSGIETSTQLELFDLSQFRLRYVSRRPPNRKHHRSNAVQLLMEDLG